MNHFTFQSATPDDLPPLTAISIRSFHSDIEYGAPTEKDGPPGYDSVEFHQRVLNDATAFYKIIYRNELAGGFWFYRKKEYTYLGRIFIDPLFHRKGIGSATFYDLFEKYSDIKKWRLETPVWNNRTRAFYLKLGFNIVAETDEDLFFEKIIEGTSA